MKTKLLILISIFFLSCRDPQPIEKYKGKNIVVVQEPRTIYFGQTKEIRVKTKDSIFYIYVVPFDARNLKQGDTIK